MKRIRAIAYGVVSVQVVIEMSDIDEPYWILKDMASNIPLSDWKLQEVTSVEDIQIEVIDKIVVCGDVIEGDNWGKVFDEKFRVVQVDGDEWGKMLGERNMPTV